MTQGSDALKLVWIIEAPRDQVFEAWTDPRQLRNWWGRGNFTCPEAEVDLRPGGSYRLVMQPTEGEPSILGGTYHEVEAPARLVYTWRWETGPAADGSESVVTVEFEDWGEHTRLALTHTEMPAGHGTADYRIGWEGGFEKFEAMLIDRAGRGKPAERQQQIDAHRDLSTSLAFTEGGAA